MNFKLIQRVSRLTRNRNSVTRARALENYVKSAPSIQNALDIFDGEWATRLPGALGQQYKMGSIPAFNDHRIAWLIHELNSIEGTNVLELGPLEGSHTFMLEQAGASSIVAIEA